jgi:hypothetical protein
MEFKKIVLFYEEKEMHFRESKEHPKEEVDNHG